MRIPLFEVGEKESIGEVLEVRSVVRHDVGVGLINQTLRDAINIIINRISYKEIMS